MHSGPKGVKILTLFGDYVTLAQSRDFNEVYY